FVMAPENGIAALDAIGREIVLGKVASLLLRLRNDCLADIAIDEEARALFGEPFKTFGELLVAECCTDLHQPAAGGENFRNPFARGEDRRDHCEEIGLEIRQRETLLRGADSGLGATLARQTRT